MSAIRAERNGLQALSTGATALLTTLDSLFEHWGTGAGATSMIMPPLLPVESLARLDFYDNFPHQALLVCALNLDKRESGTGARRTSFRSEVLESSSLALPSAACFAVYLYHEGQHLADGTTVTVLGRCFRREEHYDGLRRLLGFHMREIVALGTREFVVDHLHRFGDRIASFAAALDLTVRKEAATDPFYDKGAQRAVLQKLSPVKHEYLVGDLAIASLNVHRNFFGERCNIRLADTGESVFTSCVAFGLERWLSVLLDRYESWEAAIKAVERAGKSIEEEPPGETKF
jgi:seryl-tRNA synthetase